MLTAALSADDVLERPSSATVDASLTASIAASPGYNSRIV